MNRVAGIDVGKTGCRLRLVGPDGTLEVEGPGAPGLAEPGGVRAAHDAVRAVLDRLGTGGSADLAVLGVAAAGAEAASHEAVRLSELLAADLSCEVAVTSDSVAAHVGALGGRPGVVLAVGTGAVALGVAEDGSVHQIDGWGTWLGDDGSGAWIGRQALRAVLRHREGRGSETSLRSVVERRFGDLASLPLELSADGQLGRTAAALVPEILAEAEAGDAVARRILEAAVECWSDLASACARAAGQTRVCVVGGLAQATVLVEQFATRLPASLTVTASDGSALDGAVAIAQRRDLPHEPRIHRQEAAAHGTEGSGEHAAGVDVLATEQVRADLADLDDRTPAELVAVLLAAEATVPAALSAAAPALVRSVELAERALAAGGRIIYVGAGTPGRLAALDAAECPPTFGTDPGRVVAVLAGGDRAAARAVEGAEDERDTGSHDVLALDLQPEDLVVGVTASGRTPYVIGALEAARSAGCSSVAIVNNARTPARSYADVTVELLTGEEVLAGSTRLKAGTSQKVALNVLSTAAMVRTGRTYGAWMVDVIASNEKLRRRARRILREASGADDETALAALEAAGWQTKTALVSVLAGIDVLAAQRLLDRNAGRVRSALSEAGRDGHTSVEVPDGVARS